MLNAKLEKGDRVILMHMEEETFQPGLKGTVEKVMTGPMGEKIYSVEWDNGSKLSLLSDVDIWKKIEEKRIDESADKSKWFMENIDIVKNFDTKFFTKYLIVLRDSGIVNMFGAAPFLYMGSRKIKEMHSNRGSYDYDDDDYEDTSDKDEKFNELLELADESQMKMINGVIKVLEKEKKEQDVNTINRYIQKYAQKIVHYYMNVLS